MNYLKREKSVIDIIFIIAVLGVFMISILFVILFGARIFKRTVDDMSVNFSTRTSLSYITEKIHQHDYKGGIEINTDNGKPLLKLNEQEGEIEYSTYLYEQDGILKELTVMNDVAFAPSAGKEIIKVKDFSCSKESDSLYKFHIVDDNDTLTEFYISVYSYTN